MENLTVGNNEKATRYDLSKAVKVAEDTHSIIRSFKRNDFRIRRKVASKYGRRRTERISQAAWEGVPTITLTKKETRGTSSLCPRCGGETPSWHSKKDAVLWKV